jgi:hypothetical protein
MSKISRYFPILLLASGIAVAAPACAARIYDTGPRGGYPPPQRERLMSAAAENGYRDGIEAGRDDARHHERSDPARAKRYRQGDRGYDRRYGPRDEYQREYRVAFERGYREGYGRDDRR